MIAVALNLKQAKVIAESQPVGEAISFCPAATHLLHEKNWRVTSTAEIYKAFSHARVVVAADREMKKIAEVATGQYGLDALQAGSLATLIHNHLLCVYHLHYCLRGYRKNSFVWAHGARAQGGDYATMFESLSGQIGCDIMAYARRDYSYAHYLLAAFYNAVIFAIAGNSKRLKAMDYGDELPKRIFRAMRENGERVLVFHTHSIGKNAYKTTTFFFKSLKRILGSNIDGKPAYLFRVAPPARYRARIAPLDVKLPKAIAAAVQDMLKLAVPFVKAETEMGKTLARGVRPQLAVSEHAIYPHVLGGLSELQKTGGKHAMINHGTHTLQHGAISKLATLSWGAQQHLITPYTTHALPKSPLTAALYPMIRAGGYKMYKTGIYGTVKRQPAMDGKFVILQAGNYTDPFHHVPWCKETADEYLLAIFELIEEVSKLDNVELIIKLKNKKSATHKTIVEEYIQKLGVGGKARVDTTSKFSDLLARTHLIACNLSGTIEEALANNIPLLLHSYRKTYFHIDEETAKAAIIDGLAPVYLVKERADIGRIITALDKRRGELGNPALFESVAWPQKDLTSINEFAKDFVESVGKIGAL